MSRSETRPEADPHLDNVAHAVAALSGRLLAIEGLLYALTRQPCIDREGLRESFEVFAQDVEATFCALPMSGSQLGLLRTSLEHVRMALSC